MSNSSAYIGAEVVFGSEYQKAESLVLSTTSSGTYVQKLRMTTTSLPAGDYIIMWSATVGSNSDKTMRVRLEQDDATELVRMNGKAKADIESEWNFPFAGHAIRTLSGVHTFDIDYHKGGADARIEDARLTLWRVA